MILKQFIAPLAALYLLMACTKAGMLNTDKNPDVTVTEVGKTTSFKVSEAVLVNFSHEVCDGSIATVQGGLHIFSDCVLSGKSATLTQVLTSETAGLTTSGTIYYSEGYTNAVDIALPRNFIRHWEFVDDYSSSIGGFEPPKGYFKYYLTTSLRGIGKLHTTIDSVAVLCSN